MAGMAGLQVVEGTVVECTSTWQVWPGCRWWRGWWQSVRVPSRYDRVAGGGGDGCRVYKYLAGMAGLQVVEGTMAECRSTWHESQVPGRYGRVAGGGGDSGRVYEYLAGMAGLQVVEGIVAQDCSEFLLLRSNTRTTTHVASCSQNLF